jgi:serine/threonine protein phosphatase PrpC
MRKIEISKATRPVPGKGQDRVFSASLRGGRHLIGVADGLTGERGEFAAEWVSKELQAMARRHSFPNARSVLRQLKQRLAIVARENQPDSHTTLTCGIVEWVGKDAHAHLKFDFFAVGDSPAWRLVPCNLGGLAFQGFTIHGAPFPGEQGRVYSTVDLAAGRIDGVVHFGSVDLEPGEALVIATDGLPEGRLFWDDQEPEDAEGSPQLMRRLLDDTPLSDEQLLQILHDYDAARMLVDDDASIVVVRVARGWCP